MARSSAVADKEQTLMLPALTEAERKHLRNVLQRAEEVLRQEEWRKVKLRTASSTNVSFEPSQKEEDKCKQCVSCGSNLLWLINPIKECDQCQKTTCKNCTKSFHGGTLQFCNFCFLDLKYRMESGAWFMSDRKKAGRTQKFALEELRDALSLPKMPGRQDQSRGSPAGRSGSDLSRQSAQGHRGSVPSIIINDCDELEASGGKSSRSGGVRQHIFQRKRGDKDFIDGGRSDRSDGSLDSRSSRSTMQISQESILSLYSLAEEDFTLPADMASGDVQLSLEYERKKGILLVTVRQCRSLLPSAKSKKSSDPYVKIYLLPDKTRIAKRKTSCKKNTLNPVYNELFKYMLESSDIYSRSLWVTVWHHISLGHNVFLGEVNIPLSDVDLGDPGPKWYNLHEKREIDLPSAHLIYKGDLSMAVKHVPTKDILIVDERQVDSKGELHVWIKDAKNLIPTHSNGYSNPFVKVLLLPDKSKKNKKKTQIIRKTLCPSWNTILRFENVAASELPDRSLEITVWDHSRIGGNEFLGGVRLNLGKGEYLQEPAKWMNASGYELTLWRSVIQRSNTWVEGCLSLRAHMD